MFKREPNKEKQHKMQEIIEIKMYWHNSFVEGVSNVRKFCNCK